MKAVWLGNGILGSWLQFNFNCCEKPDLIYLHMGDDPVHCNDFPASLRPALTTSWSHSVDQIAWHGTADSSFVPLALIKSRYALVLLLLSFIPLRMAPLQLFALCRCCHSKAPRLLLLTCMPMLSLLLGFVFASVSPKVKLLPIVHGWCCVRWRLAYHVLLRVLRADNANDEYFVVRCVVHEVDEMLRTLCRLRCCCLGITLV